MLASLVCGGDVRFFQDRFEKYFQKRLGGNYWNLLATREGCSRLILLFSGVPDELLQREVDWPPVVYLKEEV